MQIPRPSDADKDRFRAAMPTAPGVEIKPMFGNLGAFVNGVMFAGLFGPDIGVRLDEADRAALTAAGGGAFGPAERPMGGYLTVPDEEEPSIWAGRALTYVATLPPKQPKKKAAKKG
jgi:TfoX/Sxy family transcriptional regulator of competence genes